MGVTQSIGMLNNLVRTLLATIVVGGLSVGGYYGYQEYNKAELNEEKLEETQAENEELRETLQARDQEIEEQQEEIAAKKKQIDKLQVSINLLTMDRRLAKIKVLKVIQLPDGQKESTVEFVEENMKGELVGKPRQFRLLGDEFYVDGRVVMFKDEYVKSADLLRGTTLFTFRKIYGNDEGPNNGHNLDQPGQRPSAYGEGEMSNFEKTIWDDFWEIAENPDKQEEMGIRAIHGQANYVRAVEGKTYYLELRSSGGASIRVSDEPAVSSALDPA